MQEKREKKFYTNKGNVINFINLDEFKNLPVVFGNKESFELININLKKIKFPDKEIKTFYFFETGRWDLITKGNQTIKLPIQDYEKS